MKSRCEIYSITLSYRKNISYSAPYQTLLMGFTGLRNVPRGKSKVKSAIVSFYLAGNNTLNDE